MSARQCLIQEEIDTHWNLMPRPCRTFLLGSIGSVNFHRLANFWFSPTLIRYTRNELAEGLCGVSLSIARDYMKLSQMDAAVAMVINGAFLLQCACKPTAETMIELCKAPLRDVDVPVFMKGARAVDAGFQLEESGNEINRGQAFKMQAYIREVLPTVLQQVQEIKINNASNTMNEWSQLGCDDMVKAPKKRQMKKKLPSKNEGTQMQLMLVDDKKENEPHSFNIRSSTTLKALFNEYAEKRGVSLRSLRFSYGGKTLFLSSAGNKTPEELNMEDQDVISVHDTSAPQEASCSSPNASQGVDSTIPKQKKKSHHKNRKSNKNKKKNKGKDETKQQNEHIKTLEDYKAEHSAKLSKLHEEVEHRLKEIRMKLNALDLERQPRKQKRQSNKKKKKNDLAQLILPTPEITGKVGKPSYDVQVGNVKNLYRTSKTSQNNPSRVVSMLDLHGCTKEEALLQLDKSLETWIDDAMQGSYPFVIPAKIVCGCGNQILSETVEKWIRENAQVANAPKNSISYIAPLYCR